MRRRFFQIFIMFFTANQFLISQFGYDAYVSLKMEELMKKYVKYEDNFVISLIPIPAEYLIAQSYSQWEEKRYNEKMMINSSKEIIKMYGNDFHAMLVVGFTGDWNSNKDKNIPNDFSEYLFLENSKGKYTRCKEADVPIISKVNFINKSVSIHLTFSTELEGESKLVTDDTESIFVVIGGLGFKDNKFEFKLPISTIYNDAPSKLKKLFISSGLWDRN